MFIFFEGDKRKLNVNEFFFYFVINIWVRYIILIILVIILGFKR